MRRKGAKQSHFPSQWEENKPPECAKRAQRLFTAHASVPRYSLQREANRTDVPRFGGNNKSPLAFYIPQIALQAVRVRNVFQFGSISQG